MRTRSLRPRASPSLRVARNRWRDAAVALSLANLLVLPIWSPTFAETAVRNQFYMTAAVHPSLFLAAAGMHVAVAGLLFAGGVLRDRGGLFRKGSEFALLLAAALATSFGRVLTPDLFHLQSPGGLLSLLGLALIGLLLAELGRQRFGSVAAALYLLLLVGAPFAVLNLGRSVLEAVSSAVAPDWAEQPRRPLAVQAPVSRRLVILLFDELDYEFLFVHRPESLRLPELDALHDRSWFAERAFPTINSTAGSAPSILSGVPVVGYDIGGPSSLTLTVRGVPTDWRALPSIFSDARQRGIRAGLVGWYLPYCRLFGALVETCSVQPYRAEPPRDFGNGLRSHLLTLARQTPGVRRHFESSGDSAHVAAWRSVLEETLEVAPRADLGLVYAHFPIPHPPPIGPQVSATAAHGYAGNVQLVDETLRQLRLSLRDAGRLHDTAVLLLSDHHHLGRQGGALLGDPRNPAHRVPLILHLPWDDGAVRFVETVSLASVRELVAAFLDGRVDRHADASSVLSRDAANRLR